MWMELKNKMKQTKDKFKQINVEINNKIKSKKKKSFTFSFHMISVGETVAILIQMLQIVLVTVSATCWAVVEISSEYSIAVKLVGRLFTAYCKQIKTDTPNRRRYGRLCLLKIHFEFAIHTHTHAYKHLFPGWITFTF